MKISSTPEYEGYENFHPRLYSYIVFLDGQEVENVLFADEEGGALTKVVEPIRVENDMVVIETLYGLVEVFVKHREVI